MNPVTLLLLASNLIPLAGLYYWGWDAFQLLILYWMETVIVAGWAMARLATLPQPLLGRMTVNGRDVPATHALLLELFGLAALVFLSCHLLFTMLLFSEGWRGRVDGPLSFLRVFLIESGAWAPLLLAFVAGLVNFLTQSPRPQFMRAIHVRLTRTALVEQEAPLDENVHGVGATVGGMLGRIAIMQAAVIFGAMLANRYGTMAPMLIVIGLKLLFDLGDGKPLQGVRAETFIGRKLRTGARVGRLPD